MRKLIGITSLLLISFQFAQAAENTFTISNDLIENYDRMNADKHYKNPYKLNESDAAKFQGVSNSQAANVAADRYLQATLSEYNMRESSIGRKVAYLEDVKAGVSIGETSKPQKIDFSIQTFQSQAKVDYSGFLNATLTYQSIDQIFDFQVVENIWERKKLIFSYTDKPLDKISAVTLKWNW